MPPLKLSFQFAIQISTKQTVQRNGPCGSERHLGALQALRPSFGINSIQPEPNSTGITSNSLKWVLLLLAVILAVQFHLDLLIANKLAMAFPKKATFH